MEIKIGDILVWNNCDTMAYQVLDIDDSRPVRFKIGGRTFRQDVLWTHIPLDGGYTLPNAWAGDLVFLTKCFNDGLLKKIVVSNGKFVFHSHIKKLSFK